MSGVLLRARLAYLLGSAGLLILAIVSVAGSQSAQVAALTTAGGFVIGVVLGGRYLVPAVARNVRHRRDERPATQIAAGIGMIVAVTFPYLLRSLRVPDDALVPAAAGFLAAGSGSLIDVTVSAFTGQVADAWRERTRRA